MTRLSLWIAVLLGMILATIWVVCFAWVFWLLGVKNVNRKFNTFVDSIVFDKNNECLKKPKELPRLRDGETLEYCCLGHPNEWYKVPDGIKDMRYFEPLKMRIIKPDGDVLEVCDF